MLQCFVCVHVLQNHDDNDYNYWQSQQSVEDHLLAELKHGKRSPLDVNSDEERISFSDIYTYPKTMDYYDLNTDHHPENDYHLK